jgi:APA family basic amino acid/polyamine antiporter
MNKQITTFDIFCIAAGVMISSGIFILPGIAYAKAGPAVFLSYGLAGIAALIGVLSIVEISTAMPRSGGDYFFITRSFGPLMGIIVGFFSWFSLTLKTAFAIFGIAEILHTLTGFSLIAWAVGIALFFLALNIRGLGTAVRFEVIIVVSLLVIMLVYIFAGLPNIDIARFANFAPEGINPIYLTAGFVFVSFGGLLNIASLSGEVKNPKKSIPRGVIASILVVTLIYILLLIVVVGTLHPADLNGSLTPVADSSRLFLGQAGYLIISLAAVLAFISTANAGIMSASRYPVALGEDHLLPPVLGRLHSRLKTPVIAILITGIFIIGSLFLELELLVKVASTLVLFSYILTNAAVIIIRESRLQNYRPTFRVPFYPYTQILSIVLFIFLLLEIGIAALETVLIIIAAGALFYIFYGRRMYRKEYALLYLIERIVNRQLSSENLENELKDILLHRDEVVADRFDELVEESGFLDLDGPLTRNALFELIADQLGADLGRDCRECHRMLIEREQESSTALTPFLAVPHVILEGEGIFKMLVVRVREGVHFSEKFDSVKAVFVLIGTKDERQFHLQALSSIAQITQNTGFEDEWIRARGIDNLKHLCLLSERRRHL